MPLRTKWNTKALLFSETAVKDFDTDTNCYMPEPIMRKLLPFAVAYVIYLWKYLDFKAITILHERQSPRKSKHRCLLYFCQCHLYLQFSLCSCWTTTFQKIEWPQARKLNILQLLSLHRGLSYLVGLWLRKTKRFTAMLCK